MRLEDGVVIGSCTGSLSLEDAKAGAMAYWQNPGWRGKPVVWDFRFARLDVDAAAVRQIAQFILTSQPSPPPSKVGFVTARDVDFGMARMFEAFREHAATEVHVFRDYEEASSWARACTP
jgi:hypothetical protein